MRAETAFGVDRQRGPRVTKHGTQLNLDLGTQLNLDLGPNEEDEAE